MSEPWKPRIVIHDLGTPFPAAPAEPANPRARMAHSARRLLGFAPKLWESLRFLVLGLVKLVPVALTLFLVISIAVEIHSNRVEIAPIVVPEDLQKQGYTPETVARQLIDEMLAIQRIARTSMQQQEAALAGEIVDFTLPGVGLSLTAMVQTGRRLLGIPQQRVTGEITKSGENVLLRLRYGGLVPECVQRASAFPRLRGLLAPPFSPALKGLGCRYWCDS